MSKVITFCSKISETHRSIGLDKRFGIIQERDQRINTSFVYYFTTNTSKVINSQ